MKKFLTIILFFGFSFNAVAASFNLSIVPDIAIHDRSTRIDGVTLSIWGENETHGVAIGFVNGTVGDSEGASIGIVNYAKGSYKGFQWGAVNFAERMNGVQLGFVNFIRHADHGIQIGLINIIEDNKQFFADFPKSIAPVMVLLNWRLL